MPPPPLAADSALTLCVCGLVLTLKFLFSLVVVIANYLGINKRKLNIFFLILITIQLHGMAASAANQLKVFYEGVSQISLGFLFYRKISMTLLSYTLSSLASQGRKYCKATNLTKRIGRHNA